MEENTMPTTACTLPAHMEAYSFSEWRPGKTTQYIGKCKQCKKAVRIGITQMKQLFGHPIKDVIFLYDYQTTQKCYQHKSQGITHWSTACQTEGCFFPHSQMTSMIALKRIDGYFSEAKKCDARCTSATGHNC